MEFFGYHRERGAGGMPGIDTIAVCTDLNILKEKVEAELNENPWTLHEMSSYGGRFDVLWFHDDTLDRICLPLFVTVTPKNGLSFSFTPSDDEYSYTPTTYYNGAQVCDDTEE